ncbi:hypothetical protein DsansV1_C25g0189551 [Dioscorea sansibarensis]
MPMHGTVKIKHTTKETCCTKARAIDRKNQGTTWIGMQLTSEFVLQSVEFYHDRV